jgi:hypothetical protein
MTAPKLTPGLSFADYCKIEAVNVSTLLKLRDVTPEEGQYAMTHDIDDTTSLVKGHAAHAALLEPAVFESLYCCQPDFGDGRTTAAKTAKAAWLEANAGKIPLTQDENAAAIGMRDKVLGRPFLKEFFSGPGQNELTLTWVDETTGLPCKARVDRITQAYGYQTLIDFKTARCLADFAIGKAQAEYAYHIRMAWYVDALNLVRPSEWRPVLVWACNEPPHVVRATEMDDDPIVEGRAVYRELLDLYAACKKSGQWPGFADGVEVVNIPPWAYRLTQPKGAF